MMGFYSVVTVVFALCALGLANASEPSCVNFSPDFCRAACPCTGGLTPPAPPPRIGGRCTSNRDCIKGQGCNCRGKCSNLVQWSGAFTINDGGEAYINCKKIGAVAKFPGRTSFNYKGPATDVIFRAKNVQGVSAGVIFGGKDLKTGKTFGTGAGTTTTLLNPRGNFFTAGSYDFSGWSKATVNVHDATSSTAVGWLALNYGAFPDFIHAKTGDVAGFRFVVPAGGNPGHRTRCNSAKAVARCAGGPGPRCSVGEMAWLRYTVCDKSGKPTTPGCGKLQMTALGIAGQIVNRDMANSCDAVCVMNIACSMPRGQDPFWKKKCHAGKRLAPACNFRK